MSSYKTLYNRLQTFINENKNGIVALCGVPGVEHTYELMAYIHSLQYVYIATDTHTCYFYASNTNELHRELIKFHDRNDYLTLSEIGLSEDTFFNTIINNLLWNISHEIDLADLDGILNDKWQVPIRVKDWNAFSKFTLGLADTIEGDIEAFRSCLVNTGPIVSHGKKFQIGLTYDEHTSTFVLNEWVWEVFKDEETGIEYPIERTRPLLQCHLDWRVLYAKFRLAYYHILYPATQ